MKIDLLTNATVVESSSILLKGIGISRATRKIRIADTTQLRVAK